MDGYCVLTPQREGKRKPCDYQCYVAVYNRIGIAPTGITAKVSIRLFLV